MLERLISMTLAGGLAYVLLLIFKRLLTRRPKTLYFACLLVILLFIFPFRPTVSLRLSRKVSFAPAPIETVVQAPSPVIEAANGEAAAMEEAEEAPIPSTPINRTPFTLGEIIAALWLTGAALIFIRYIISYLLFRRRILKNSEIIDVKSGLRVVRGKVASPMLVGFFRPVIVMPAVEMDEEDYLLSVRHELTHWRRRDPWIKLLAAAVNSLHWFNPAAYALIHTLDEACEYACDSEVIKTGDEDIRRRYSTMLLNMVCNSSPILSENMARSKKQLTRRFELIMKLRKRNIFTTAISIVAAIGLAFGAVAVADSAAPMISSLFEQGYVQVGDYYTEDPVYIDGELYLPLRELLCGEGRGINAIDNQYITYDNGRVTVQVWSVLRRGADGTIAYPSQHLWDAVFDIGSPAVDIDGNAVELSHAPVLRSGVTYVPYELIKIMKDYEAEYNKMLEEAPGHWDTTDIDNYDVYSINFTDLTVMIYDSLKNEYFTDYGNLISLGEDEGRLFIFSDLQVSIAKSGQRTEFALAAGYKDVDEPEAGGTVEVTLDSVTRIFGSGRHLEGLFTVVVNGETVAQNQTGYLNNLPDAEGGYDNTRVVVDGYIDAMIFFKPVVGDPYGLTDGYDEYNPVPSAVKLNGFHADGILQHPIFRFSPEKGLAHLSLVLYEETESGKNTYYIRLNTSPVTDVSEDGFRAEFEFGVRSANGASYMVDSFTAMVSGVKQREFNLVSDDGRYIIQGSLPELGDAMISRNRIIGMTESEDIDDGVTFVQYGGEPVELPPLTMIE